MKIQYRSNTEKYMRSTINKQLYKKLINIKKNIIKKRGRLTKCFIQWLALKKSIYLSKRERKFRFEI